MVTSVRGKRSVFHVIPLRRSACGAKRLTILLQVAVAVLFWTQEVCAQSLLSGFPVTNDEVTAMVKDGDTLYVGGRFTYAGPNTGNGVVLDLATANYSPSFPKVNGAVYACASDSQGGWYIGGAFNKVGSAFRANAAHILADGTVDAWNPSPDNEVRAIAFCRSKVYVGGFFSHIGVGTSNFVRRNGIAAVDVATGVASAWDPDPDGVVTAIAVSDATVYIGGVFANLKATSANPWPRSNLAAVDTVSDGTPTRWNPGVTTGSGVYGMLLADHDSTLYLWGNISAIARVTRYGAGAVPTYANLPTDWNPSAYRSTFVAGNVYALAISGDTVFLGGDFTRMKTNSTFRNNLAAVSRSGSGTVLSWNPNISGVWPYSSLPIQTYPPAVYSIAVSGDLVYVGGAFSSVGGLSRSNLAAVDRKGIATAWDPHAADGFDGKVRALGFSGNKLYAGGEFMSVNGATRHGLAAMNLASNTVTSWNPGLGSLTPNVEPNVFSLAQDDSTLFVGGYFDTVGVQAIRSFAAICKATALPAAFPLLNASFGTGWTVVNVQHNKLYISGAFTAIGDSARNNLCSVDLSTRRVTTWYPHANFNLWTWDHISTFAGSGSTMYISGDFDSVGTAVRKGLAAVDDSLGIATSWNPFAGITDRTGASAMTVSGSTVYIGGWLFGVGTTTTRRGLAAIDASTGTYEPWNPDLYNMTNYGVIWVSTMAIAGSNMYVSGNFTSVGGAPRSDVAAIDLNTGIATPWNPNIVKINEGYVSSMVLDTVKHTVYIGGRFFQVGTDQVPYLVACSDPSMNTMGVTGDKLVPAEFALLQNYPNPFNPSTVIAYSVPTTNQVSLRIYNVLGQEIVTLVDGRQAAGRHEVSFNAGRLASGVYYYQLRIGGSVVTKQMMLIK